MTSSIGPSSAAAQAPAAPTRDEQRLRQAAEQFESVFVRQMFAAMRSTVPSDGVFEGGAGEEMFTTLFDESVADDAPAQLGEGFSQQILAQFRNRANAILESRTK